MRCGNAIFLGASGLFTVVFKAQYTPAQINTMVEHYQYFGIGYSWGGFESLALPVHPNHLNQFAPQLASVCNQWCATKSDWRMFLICYKTLNRHFKRCNSTYLFKSNTHKIRYFA